MVKCLISSRVFSFRKGIYPVAIPAEGAGIGGEGCGVVEQIGEGVELFKVGDQVAYSAARTGAYADFVLVDAEKAVHVPSGLEADTVAASFLKGMTARYLCKETYAIRPGSRALVYAAAGATGQILVQWIKHLGGIVIAVVSTEAKAAICRSLGADHTILSNEDIAARVAQLGGKVVF